VNSMEQNTRVFCEIDVQEFHLRSQTRLIRSAVKYWKPGKFLKFFFMIEKHKTIFSGLRIFEMTLSSQSQFPRFFSPPEDNLPGPGQFRLTTNRNRLSPEDDFRQLVSSNPRFRFIAEIDFGWTESSQNSLSR
jgi:hypothetical protein